MDGFENMAEKTMKIILKRAYDPAEEGDGFRVLVYRLWPRGISKAEGNFGLWLKEIAPSSDLRKWFGHDPAKWHEFKERYFKELDANQEAVRALESAIQGRETATFAYGAKDREHNNALALLEYLQGRGILPLQG